MAVESRRHILVGNLPRTALPADIQRTIRRERLVGVDDGEGLNFVHVLLLRHTSPT
jgi:hypothetical protein